MMFVADSGPIISFARADRLAIVRDVVCELWIPDAVYHEVVIMGAGMPGAEEVSGEDWIKRRSLTSLSTALNLPGTLGDGEREAIARRIILAVRCAGCNGRNDQRRKTGKKCKTFH